MRASSPASTPTCTPHRCAADRRTCLWRTSSPSPGSGVPASILGDRQNAVPHPIGGRRRGQTPIAPLGTTGYPPVAVCRPTDPRPRWPILAYGEKSGLGSSQGGILYPVRMSGPKAGVSAAGAVVAALLASACCIGPAILAIAGLGGAASAL